MEVFHNLIYGLSVALSLENLAYCFIGCLIGTVVGVLPGIGPLATIAMLLPITFKLPATTAIIMLAGIYYGAQYGGSTTSILVNLPGETSSIITCIDGYQMARQGRGGPALAIAAIASFFAGTVCTVIIFLFSPPLIEMALKFGPADYFSVMLMGLVIASVLTEGELLNSLAMSVLGLLLGCVGMDMGAGFERFTFGYVELTEGISFVTVAVGVFAVAEIIRNLSNPSEQESFTGKLTHLLPTKEDLKRCAAPIVRGTALGAFFGVLPGTGPAIASFSSYMIEKKLSKDPSRFGHGAIEGVAGPEAANNADAQCKFIPMLTLGIPASATMGLFLGVLMMQGIAPGPTVMVKNPDLFWGVIASMWVGNLALLVLNLPLVGVWVNILRVPYRLLFPAIMLFCGIGIYTISNSTFDHYLTIIFTILGFIWTKLRCSPVPLMLGFVLEPLLEQNLRRALLLSRGDPTVFFTRPISLGFMIATILVLVMMAIPTLRKRRGQIVD